MNELPETTLKAPKIRLTGRIIYEVTVQPVGSLNAIRQRESTVIFFSNLRKAVDAITAELALNNWPQKVNYTAVYRGVKQRGFYSCDFDVAGTRVFRIKVVPQVLNPALPRLGIDENPTK
ncbi:hypothetical protein [Spirosoma utsteinense]|uniref:Uncharacterized protein n=1 Tax=Spirosoma utsteinense TaxID=2585773 RepID=A0ABR6W0L4_9BACT|nr:hypothetical protein [Spirosoma utsteinense]MBC3783738.1 hypothetical protein [Spirosoma utsteinense]MBC3790119.1 hypothetical protein [Spirosoma utsteinense]